MRLSHLSFTVCVVWTTACGGAGGPTAIPGVKSAPKPNRAANFAQGGGERLGQERPHFQRSPRKGEKNDELTLVDGAPRAVSSGEFHQVPSARGARHLPRYEISGGFTGTITDGPRVPDFQLIERQGEGTVSQLVGREAFVIVFFATWSELAARKLETVKTATARVPGARLLLVALDDPETSGHVPGFLREHRLEHVPVVDGLAHPGFLASYNPSSSLPQVTVVGRRGELIEAQLGLWSGDGQRLEKALALALQ